MALKTTQKLYLVLKFSKSENKFFNSEFKRLLTTTASSALTPLFRLIKVENVCFNFLLIICILSSQVISWQIPLFAIFPQFPWSTFSLSSYFKLHNLSGIWDLMSQQMTWPYHCRQFWIIIHLIFITTHTLSQRTTVDTLSTNLTPHILIIQISTPHNLALLAIVSSYISQQYIKTGLT